MKPLAKFSIEQYLETARGAKNSSELRYEELLRHVKRALDRDWERTDDTLKAQRLAREKGAIRGIERDVNELKDKIRLILAREGLLQEPFPSYYPSLTDAIFSDLYGLGPIAPWAFEWKDEYRGSSSAKIIGDRIYCLINGRSELQPQTISEQRRGQLVNALLIATPKERKEYGFHEVYLHNGIRVTIYSGERCKPGQDIIVFRKYVVKRPTLEALAELGTFPQAAVPLFKEMCAAGFNVVFAGQVRSGKTTLLQAWQACEDPSLEGVAVATDPETRWENILPGAPLMQLVADGEELAKIEKSLKRSDADYVILEEMRDAAAYNLFLGITSMGTMRSKATIHDSSALNIPFKMASAISTEIGGDRESIISQIFTNVNFVFELGQLPADRSQKRLLRITEFTYDPAENRVFAKTLCRYDPENGSFSWAPSIGKDKEEIAARTPGCLENIREILGSLSGEHPLSDERPVYPAYYGGNLSYRGKEDR